MNVKTFKQLLLTFTVILTVLVSLGHVTPVLAEETIPPQTEPAPAENPAEAAPTDAAPTGAPSGEPQPSEPADAAPTSAPSGEPQPSEPADAVPTGAPSGEPQPSEPADTAPTGEAPPAEPTADPTEPPAAEQPAPPQEELTQLVETLDQNDIVLVDNQGEPLPLASEEAVEVLQGGSDPWYVAADGSVIGYSATGICAAVVTVCNTTATPLADAIAAAPAGSTIVIDGTYAEQVTINKNLTLQGATTGGTLRTPASVTQYGTAGLTRVYALVQVTNNAVVNFENLTIENRLLNGTVDTNPIDSYGGFAYFAGIWFNNGRGAINNSTIQEFVENSWFQNGIGIYVGSNSDNGVTVQYSNIYNNEQGIRVEGDNVTIQRNNFEDNTTGVQTESGSSLDVHYNNFYLGSNSDTSFDDNNSSTIDASNNHWVDESGTVCSYTGAWWGAGSWNSFRDCANISGLNSAQIGGTSGDSQTAWSLDPDGDGFSVLTGTKDNCPTVSNPSQADNDNDGLGDACDPDNDSDGKLNTADNCPLVYNPSQTDSDSDGMGDACDPFPQDPQNDIDGDGVSGHIDNCPTVANPSQTDSDGDGMGDACDPFPQDPQNDIDGDGVSGHIDNCPTVANPSQTDSDGDGMGDACDPFPQDPQNDIDGDGVSGHIDNCPTVANPSQTDSDSDGMGDACDPFPQDPQNDIDGDGVSGHIDNCPTVANPTQTDSDGDGMGDACDPFPQDPQNDIDGDGVSGHIDNCPTVANPSQTDSDGDGMGDACDPFPQDPQNDIDGDGVSGHIDNCPTVANPSQTDSDGDGMGDACDPFPQDPDNDIDQDGVGGDIDNCPLSYNPAQTDSDGDGIGNACDPTPFGSGNGSSASPSGNAAGGGAFIIPVTGKQPAKIDCSSSSTILQLSNSNRALFTGLCGYDALLENQSKSSVTGLKELPAGSTYLSGMSVSILKDNIPAKPFPASGAVTLSFVIPEASQGKKLSILYWDAAAGEWVKLPAQQLKDGKVVPSSLGAGSDASVLNGVHTSGGRIEVTVNFDGTFVLVAE